MASTNYKRVLNEFAAKEDKKFVKYGEQKDVHKACIHHKEKAKKHANPLHALKAINLNLALTETQKSTCWEKP